MKRFNLILLKKRRMGACKKSNPNKEGSTEPNKNILLEFTATVPKNAAVQKV